MDLGGFAAVEEESLLKIAARHAQEYTRDFLPEFAQRGERFAYLYNRNLNEVLAVVRDVGQELRASNSSRVTASCISRAARSRRTLCRRSGYIRRPVRAWYPALLTASICMKRNTAHTTASWITKPEKRP